MAQAIYHSNRGEKSALILLKANPFQMSHDVAYVPRESVVNLGVEVGETFTMPDGFKLVDFIDPETKLVRTTKDGEPLKTLKW